MDIIRARLHNQKLSKTTLKAPEQVVSWLGAVQSQDFAGAKWAVAQRTTGLMDAEIEQAFTDGTILRTHVLRPTWHFVTPADIRWLLALTAPRILALSAYYFRQLELDKSVFNRSHAALTKTLQGGRQLTRAELATVLKKNKIPADNLLRFTYIMIRAELDGIICSGARRGKQFTYALLDERAPKMRSLEKDEALAELAKRYFASRGPATLKDFAWWSGLTISEARSGIDGTKTSLFSEVADGQTYWYSESRPTKTSSPLAHLLADYDEYIVGYADRGAIFDKSHTNKLDSRGSVLAQYTIMIDGQVRGTWKRTLNKDSILIELNPFSPLTKAEAQAVDRALSRYGKYLNLPIRLA